MSNDHTSEGQAEISRRRLSWVWLIPIASLAVGGWLLWSTLARRGPLIDITFDTAEGLAAGQSQVKFKDVQMGTVEGFDLTPDRKVLVHARMTAAAEPLLTEGAQFWVVKPRVFGGDITGLNTLVSGSYIDMLAGKADRPMHQRFTGLEEPPAEDPSRPGREFRLTAPRIGGLSVGSPVFYRDVEVGKVVKWQMASRDDKVTLTINVRAPYDSWVHDDSRFWNTSGVGVKLGADGVKLEVDSIKAVLLGGITFETPRGEKFKDASAAGHGFTLHPNVELADAAAFDGNRLATYLSGTAGGLAPGAPVMLLGFRVGTVTDVVLQFNTDTDRARVRAGFVVDVDKVVPVGGKPMPPFPDYWRSLVADGLRIHLKGGNLLTGQQQLALEIDTDGPSATLGQEGETVILPASQAGGGGLDELSTAATQLLAKIGKMPFAEIGANLNATLAGANGVISDPRLKEAIGRVDSTLAAARDLVKHVDAAATPALKRLPAIATELDGALGDLRGLVASVSAGSAGSGKFGRDLDHLLQQVTETAQSVRGLADLLSRHPEALIRGRTSRSVE